MAKSAGFFTLRRGSTKSLTFQVLDGKQITKDRVTVVRNPKTSRQAEQRAKLLPAQRFMTMLRSIVDHSWENVAYGQKSLQHFMSKAMRIQPENPMVKGEIGWYPQSYPISEGSLPTMGAYLEGGESASMSVPGLESSSTILEQAIAAIGIQEGDQLTAIGVEAYNDTYIVRIDRVIVNTENFSVNSGALIATSQNGIFNFNITEGQVGLVTANDMVACAIILSRRTSSKWLRSSETMAAYNVNNVLWSTAVASYMNAASELTSPWYLNAADNDVISEQTANNGEWVPMLLAAAANPGSDSNVYLGAKNNLYGNFAFVTKSGRWNDVLPNVALSSSRTLQSVTLSDFNYDSGDTAETIAGRDTLKYAGALGSTALTAMPDEQPDELVALAKVQ